MANNVHCEQGKENNVKKKKKKKPRKIVETDRYGNILNK